MVEDENINTDMELQKLNKLLKSNKDSYPSDLKNSLDSIVSEVQIEHANLIANITCPVCDKKIKAQNCSENGSYPTFDDIS